MNLSEYLFTFAVNKPTEEPGRIMENGISIYPGLDNTLDENVDLIRKAADCGIKRIFTSLHIPETDRDKLKQDLTYILQYARKCGMEIISDVAPLTMEMLGMNKFDLSVFKSLGIGTLRLDDGYDVPAIAKLSRNKHGIRIQLNASTVTQKMLDNLKAHDTDFANLDALHNFYPREGTGVSENFLATKTAMLHGAGIKVGAFVPGNGKKRPPLFLGLPTMEEHRLMDVDLAARHLVALGIDHVFIGDSLPLSQELRAVGSLKPDEVKLTLKTCVKDEGQTELLGHTFTARDDEARDAVRAKESRILVRGEVQPENTVERPRGAVTIDNINYLRYMGELQIIKNPLPADERVNVVGHIDEQEIFLMNHITPGRKFSFRLV